MKALGELEICYLGSTLNTVSRPYPLKRTYLHLGLDLQPLGKERQQKERLMSLMPQ